MPKIKWFPSCKATRTKNLNSYPPQQKKIDFFQTIQNIRRWHMLKAERNSKQYNL